jgi:hypothetical protein
MVGGSVLGLVLAEVLRGVGVPPIVVVGTIVGALVLVPFGIAVYKGFTGPRHPDTVHSRFGGDGERP